MYYRVQLITYRFRKKKSLSENLNLKKVSILQRTHALWSKSKLEE